MTRVAHSLGKAPGIECERGAVDGHDIPKISRTKGIVEIDSVSGPDLVQQSDLA